MVSEAQSSDLGECGERHDIDRAAAAHESIAFAMPSKVRAGLGGPKDYHAHTQLPKSDAAGFEAFRAGGNKYQ